MEIPVRQSIVQEIPVVNSTSATMTAVANFTNKTCKAFSGPDSISIPPNSTVNYPLKFHPIHVGEAAFKFHPLKPFPLSQMHFVANSLLTTIGMLYLHLLFTSREICLPFQGISPERAGL